MSALAIMLILFGANYPAPAPAEPCAPVVGTWPYK